MIPILWLLFFCRWGSGFWELGVQHLWVCPHAAGEQQVQEHGEESPARAHLLHHPVHADHRGAGEEPRLAHELNTGVCTSVECRVWLFAIFFLRLKCGRRIPSSLWRMKMMTPSRTRSGFLLKICCWWDTNTQPSGPHLSEERRNCCRFRFKDPLVPESM